MIYSGFLDLVGKTPVIELTPKQLNGLQHIRLYAKLEFYNPTGSIKDRPAAFITRKLLINKEIDKDTTIIESSSGNFGVALSAVCRAEGLKFICVVDPLILKNNEYLLHQSDAKIVKVTKRDDNGGYLKARLQKVRELLEQIPNSKWINQYGNKYNAQAHYFGTGMEIYKVFSDIGLDYVFVSVSSGGTIAGVSQILKEHFPDVKIIAVDTEGSVIFGDKPRKRCIPGMGSSIIPSILRDARIDDIVHVREEQIIESCVELLQDHGLFVGGSSGAGYCAVKKYFKDKQFSNHYYKRIGYPQRYQCEADPKPHVLMIFADRGERYNTTIYDTDWMAKNFPHLQCREASCSI